MKKYLFAFLSLSFIFMGVALATRPEKVTICHAAGLDGTLHFETLELAYPAVYGEGGHFNEGGTPQAGHEDDYLGACANPSPSPSASPSPNPSPSPSGSPQPSQSPQPSESPLPSETPAPSETPVPSETPRPTLVPTPNPTPSPIPPAKEPEYVCPVTQVVANPLVWRKGDEAIVQWQATQGNYSNIYYKQVTSPDWQYALHTDNDGYELIKGLGSLDISFAVQQECGPLSKTIVDGPTPMWVLFR